MNPVKNHLLRFAFILIISSSAKFTFGQTQTEMNINANKQYKKADLELNSSYQKIMKEYASQHLFIENLKKAQRLWLQLRDAELAAKFPETGKYGSAELMCKVMYLEELTKDRNKFLRTWVTGIAEGDVCNGSVKLKK